MSGRDPIPAPTLADLVHTAAVRPFIFRVGSREYRVPFSVGFYAVPGVRPKPKRGAFPRTITVSVDVKDNSDMFSDFIKFLLGSPVESSLELAYFFLEVTAKIRANEEIIQTVKSIINDHYPTNMDTIFDKLAALSAFPEQFTEEIDFCVDHWDQLLLDDRITNVPLDAFERIFTHGNFAPRDLRATFEAVRKVVEKRGQEYSVLFRHLECRNRSEALALLESVAIDEIHPSLVQTLVSVCSQKWRAPMRMFHDVSGMKGAYSRPDVAPTGGFFTPVQNHDFEPVVETPVRTEPEPQPLYEPRPMVNERPAVQAFPGFSPSDLPPSQPMAYPPFVHPYGAFPFGSSMPQGPPVMGYPVDQQWDMDPDFDGPPPTASFLPAARPMPTQSQPIPQQQKPKPTQSQPAQQQQKPKQTQSQPAQQQKTKQTQAQPAQQQKPKQTQSQPAQQQQKPKQTQSQPAQQQKPKQTQTQPAQQQKPKPANAAKNAPVDEVTKTWSHWWDEERNVDGVIRYLEQRDDFQSCLQLDGGGSKKRQLHYLLDLDDQTIFDGYWDSFDKDDGHRPENTWVQYHFLKHVLIPTHYTVATSFVPPNNSCPKTWTLLGSVDGTTWDVLDQVVRSDRLDPSRSRERNAMATFPITQRKGKAYSWFRFKQEQNHARAHSGNEYELRLCGIEFYGLLRRVRR